MILQKSVTINCAPMFHLVENGIVAVKRTDKEGSPVERHLIQSFTIPIAETGTMSINCTSVNDIPTFDVTAPDEIPSGVLFGGNMKITTSQLVPIQFPAGADTSAPSTWTVRIIPPDEYATTPNTWVYLPYSDGSFYTQLPLIDCEVAKTGSTWYFRASDHSAPASGTYYLQIYIQS